MIVCTVYRWTCVTDCHKSSSRGRYSVCAANTSRKWSDNKNNCGTSENAPLKIINLECPSLKCCLNQILNDTMFRITVNVRRAGNHNQCYIFCDRVNVKTAVLCSLSQTLLPHRWWWHHMRPFAWFIYFGLSVFKDLLKMPLLQYGYLSHKTHSVSLKALTGNALNRLILDILSYLICPALETTQGGQVNGWYYKPVTGRPVSVCCLLLSCSIS